MKYKDAGVDIEAGNRLASRFGDMAIRTMNRPGTDLTMLGGFGACFQIPKSYKDPVLVASTDGVGSKLLLVNDYYGAKSVGQDLVAMVTNDLLCSGAEPLFLLDYIAAGSLESSDALLTDLMEGITDACKEVGAALIGGETAELPLMYNPGAFDLAAFGVGVVEQNKLQNPEYNIEPGQVVMGIASNGIHSNGFSLVNKLVNEDTVIQDMLDIVEIGAQPLRHAILRPTHLYSRAVLDYLRSNDVAGMAHITGGGLIGNLARILPEGCDIKLQQRTGWAKQMIFDWIAREAGVNEIEMYKTFNMGIGFAVILPEEQKDGFIKCMNDYKFNAWEIGRVIEQDQDWDCRVHLEV